MEGSLLLFALVAISATLILLIVGTIAMVPLRRAIKRNMAATAQVPIPDAALPIESARRAPAVPLALNIADASKAARNASLARDVLRRMILAHVLAGLVFGIVAAPLFLLLAGLELLPVRTATLACAFAWPTALVLWLVVGPDLRARSLIVLSSLVLICILCSIAWVRGTPDLTLFGISLPGFIQPAFLWLLNVVPTLFLLLFLVRTIRTVFLVLVFVFAVLLGGYLAFFTLLTIEMNLAAKFFVYIFGADAVTGGIFGLCMLAAIWPAWRVTLLLRDRYATKRSSDLMLTVSTIWLLQSFSLAVSLTQEQGLVVAMVGLVPLLAWRLVVQVGLRPIVGVARSRPPQPMLFLRVFGFGRRSGRLLELLGARWRLVGSIDLIASPDLASRTIEPATFLDFMRGRLARLFIRTSADLEERLALIDRKPDPDGRFRLNQLFCSDNIWREAVVRLMGEASLIVMDLRGFDPQRRGCVFELQTLLDTVPLDRLLLLVDRTTDRPALECLLKEQWQQLASHSPNLELRSPTIRLLDTTGSNAQTVRTLLGIVESRQPSFRQEHTRTTTVSKRACLQDGR